MNPMRNKIITHRAPILSRIIALGMLLVFAATVSSTTRSLSLSRVAVDRNSFEPNKGEGVMLRYRISQPANVTVKFFGPQGHQVRRLQRKVSRAGEQSFRWDGKDDQGKQVPDEAYLYTLTAKSDSGEEVTYDLSLQTGGEQIYPQNLSLDPETGAIHYRLAKPARVRLIVSGEAHYWPIRTLLNWSPRTNGLQTEAWNGWDAKRIINALKQEKIIPILYAFALPSNTVIVKGKAADTASLLPAKREQGKASSTPVPLVDARMLPRTKGASPVHFHAAHPWVRCYNPTIEARLPKGLSKNKKGLPIIQRTTALSIDIAKQQPAGRLRPIERVSVFIYVDGKMVERLLSGYTPYQWIIDPAELSPGEHAITGLFTWRDDHFGMVHKKIWVEQSQHSLLKSRRAN